MSTTNPKTDIFPPRPIDRQHKVFLMDYTEDGNSADTQPEAGSASGLIIPDATLPGVLYIVPSPRRPFFPAQIQPIVLPADPWRKTADKLHHEQSPFIGLIYCDQNSPQTLDTETAPEFGCAVRVHGAQAGGEHLQLMVQGLKRFRVRRWISRKPPLLAEVDYPENAGVTEGDEIRAHAMAIINAIKELVSLNPLYSEELRQYVNHFSVNDPSLLTDFAAAITTASGDQLQQILETLPLLERMQAVLQLVLREREVAELQSKITDEVNEKVSVGQREFFLREQLKIIQKELGITKDDKTADAEDFREALEGKTLPAAAAKRIDEELDKLQVLETGSPEYGVTRNWLEWATAMPWGVLSHDNLDLDHARRVLDKDHDGLDDVKKRIIEFLALATFRGEVAGSIILLVGPPGVGKTSIGRSVAAALERPFYRFSLGGMRDEAEIKGHRRTYIGAMPGKMVQALKECEVANPVIMLDEIDKIGASYQGDPASALLEVLDPEQNVDFLDHYLDLRLDLSNALFICTANQLDTIPGPLLDRMETIRLSGYLAEEKMVIAKNHLWPRLLKRSGIKKSQISLQAAALRKLIDGYAREAGVRNLEKQLARLVRKSAVRLLEGGDKKISINATTLTEMLGPPQFNPEAPRHGVGVVNGLAWTAMGGAMLAVECSRVHARSAGFKLTGKLGDVMRESAEIAYSYATANAGQYGVPDTFFAEALIHLHVPEGATPKDGPSAGVTMTAALLSLARNKKPKAGIAMTGEMTLTGEVLPVGGIREKIIAAKRAGIRRVLLPDANRRDYDDLPDYVRKGIAVSFARHFDDVAAAML